MVRGGLLERLERRSRTRDSKGEAVDGRQLVIQKVQDHIIDSHETLLHESRSKPEGRDRLRSVIENVIARNAEVSSVLSRESLTDEILDDVTGIGPLEPLMRDETISEIMVNAYDDVWIERAGQMLRSDIRFRDQTQLLEVISRAVAPLGRRVDHSVPYVDGRLPDGSRLHACIPPISMRGPVITIRKFQRRRFSLPMLVELNTLSQQASEFLRECVMNRLNIIVAGGTGSGKTCTLNALLSELESSGERVITIEDCAELNSGVENIVSLESRQPNIEGAGEITIRTLVKNSLRMRPDRLVIGEVRGAEAFDMLQAMNTGHPGSMSTVHSNSPEDAVTRIESMALLVPEMPERVVHDLTPAALDLIVYQRRLSSGRRAVTDISLMEKGISHDDGVRLVSLFRYRPERADDSLVRVDAPLPEWFQARTAWRSIGG